LNWNAFSNKFKKLLLSLTRQIYCIVNNATRLANGHRVYYKNYPEPGTRLDRDTVREDFYPAHWVPVDSAINQSPSLIFVFLFSIVALLTIQ
jgi:hypothetical protein